MSRCGVMERRIDALGLEFSLRLEPFGRVGHGPPRKFRGTTLDDKELSSFGGSRTASCAALQGRKAM